MQRSYQSTKYACYVGYVVQAVINNLAPLLFVIFSNGFHITLSRLSALITVNFLTQTAVDIISVGLVDRVGYRILAVLSQAITFFGLIFMGSLPFLLPEPFWGIVISIIFCAIGSGLTEVIISPIVESLPSDKKTGEMSLLHSFYCWGQVLVVLVTTLLIKIAGDRLWFLAPLMWSVMPLLNSINFLTVPLMPTISREERTPLGKMLLSPNFILLLVIMLCAGASELAMSQWSSYFAETGLKVSKVTGDLLGPCLFAAFMGTGRTLFGLFGEKMKIKPVIIGCAGIAVICYIGTSLSQNPILSLLFCAVTGLGVSVMWPATFSLAARVFPAGGGSMFGILALAGDMGCAAGPWLISFISVAENAVTDGEALKAGLGFGALFPIVMTVALLLLKASKKSTLDNRQ